MVRQAPVSILYDLPEKTSGVAEYYPGVTVPNGKENGETTQRRSKENLVPFLFFRG